MRQDERDYPPCFICGGPNDLGEVCARCAKEHGQGPLEKSDEESQREELRYEEPRYGR